MIDDHALARQSRGVAEIVPGWRSAYVFGHGTKPYTLPRPGKSDRIDG
jgi:hypothetical protein